MTSAAKAKTKRITHAELSDLCHLQGHIEVAKARLALAKANADVKRLSAANAWLEERLAALEKQQQEHRDVAEQTALIVDEAKTAHTQAVRAINNLSAKLAGRYNLPADASIDIQTGEITLTEK